MSLLMTALQKAEKSRTEGGLRRDDLALEPLDSADFTAQERTAYDPAQAATLLTAGERVSPLFDFAHDHSFGLVLSVLLLAGVGWGTYVWLQIQSPELFIAKSAPGPDTPPVQAPGPLPITTSAAPNPAPVVTAASIETVKPVVEVKAEAAPLLEQKPAPVEPPEPPRQAVVKESPPPQPKAVPVARAQPAAAPAPGASESEIRINRAVESPPETSLVMQAYAAFQGGQYAAAKSLYQEAQRSDPKNADALLGLAAIAASEGNSAEASQFYLKALERDPRNPVAQAGVLGMVGRADPASAEVRLKTLIAKEPSAYLYSVLGALYAEQSQWTNAQAAYFQAHHLAPDNADYAFNLAIGLEHVNQPKLALAYYRKALEFAHARSSFDRAAAQNRIAELQSLER